MEKVNKQVLMWEEGLWVLYGRGTEDLLISQTILLDELYGDAATLLRNLSHRNWLLLSDHKFSKKGQVIQTLIFHKIERFKRP